jgi:phasin
MKETNTSAGGSKSAGPPTMEVPQAINAMAEKETAQAKESYDKMTAATADASNLIQNACSSAAQGAMECNSKIIEFARANTNAALDYANELLGVKSPSDFVIVVTAHARKQFDILSAQTKELTALSQKVLREATEPLKAGAAKAFRGPLA